MKKFIMASAAFAMASAAPLTATANDISVSTSIDYVSEYVFRGISLESEAIQPGVEVAVGDFAVGAWASTGFGSDSLADTDEVDFYAGYSFGLTDIISGSVGGTWYHFPDNVDTYEVSLGLAFDTLLAPSVTGYYDFELEAFTLEGGLSHSVPVSDKASFDLGLTAALVDADGGSYEYGLGSAALSYAFTDDVSTYVGVNYSLNSEDLLDYDPTIGQGTDDNLFWAGIGVAAGF